MSGLATLDLALLERLIELTLASLVLLAGASVGSFLNVVAHRLPQNLSVVRPRSRCPSCEKSIAWYDNIPVLSFLVLGGRCRHCKARISFQYPLIEALCGVLALAQWWLLGPSAQFFVQVTVIGLLVALALIDGAHFLLPESLTVPLIAVALIGRLMVALVDQQAGMAAALSHALDGVLGAALGAGLLAIIAWTGTRIARRTGRIDEDQDAMGWGDVMLIAGIGAHLGSPAVLVVLFLASVQGAVIGAVLLTSRRGATTSGPSSDEARQDESGADEATLASPEPGDDEDDWQPPAHAIPFGPYLALGAIEWMVLERTLSAQYERILSWLIP
ncbi:MAG: prepilin peptidase [Pseudomonadota bacterium]